jgi:hypothetical protein
MGGATRNPSQQPVGFSLAFLAAWREKSVFMKLVKVLADIAMGCAALHPSYLAPA